jgi:hypothetical protein
MRVISKNFWDAVLTKLIETAISVKIWILVVIVFFVNRLYSVADELRLFMVSSITEVEKMKVLCSLQCKVYDIATSLIISGIVVIVLSRVTFQYAKLKNGYHNGTLSVDQKEDVDELKNNFA